MSTTCYSLPLYQLSYDRILRKITITKIYKLGTGDKTFDPFAFFVLQSAKMDDHQLIRKIERDDHELEEADLRFKMLGNDGCQRIAKALETNTHLRRLVLTNNEIGNHGCKYLGKALIKNYALKSLDLSFNPNITDKGATFLLNALDKNFTLTQLILLFNKQISSGVTKQIKTCLDRNLDAPQHTRSKKGEKDRDEKKKKEKKKARHATTHGDLGKADEMAVKILTSKLEKAEEREKEYLKKIEELEKKLKNQTSSETSSPPLASSSPSSSSAFGSFSEIEKRKNKEFKINFSNLLVTEKLAATGGSNAGVYACYVDGWQCAMKELTIQSARLEKSQINGFESEIGLLEQLPHNNHIVKYLHHERAKDKIRLYMTKYSSTLAIEIKKRRVDIEAGDDDPFSPQEIMCFMLDLTAGLGFLHERNIIHRDLKSDNVFVTLNERKEIMTLAIGDFDIAKSLSSDGPAMTLVGTPAYMAPEVLAQEGAYSLKADVYSLGMVLYELLAMKIPYADDPPFRLTTNILQGILPTLPAIGEEYSAIVELYKKCVDLHPQNRPTVPQIKEILTKIQT